MLEENAFEARFRAAQLEAGSWRTSSTDNCLKMWRDHVETCEEGYDWNTDEYDFDLQARDSLELALNDPVLNEHEEIEALRARVHEIDAGLRSILHDQPVKDPAKHPWWECYVPRYGTREFAKDVYRRYGIGISTVD
ncbi:hypothetical protein ACOQFL_03885 [Actinopolyspora sp. H202]|uniref:hypothetical protein n=1 Tax=Actinopolyspora sp. H202 TaxID=1500456 RepID=UPI003EE732E5